MKALLASILITGTLMTSSCGKDPQVVGSAISPEHAATLEQYVLDQDAGTVSELTAYKSVPEAVTALISSSDGRSELSTIAQGARSIAFDSKSKAAYIVTRKSLIFAQDAGIRESIHDCVVIHAPASSDPMIWSFVSPHGQSSFAPVNMLFVDDMSFENDNLVFTVRWTEDQKQVSKQIPIKWKSLQSPNGIGQIDTVSEKIIP